MIENSKQYEVTKAAAKKFSKAYQSILARTDLHPMQKQAYLDSYASQIAELNAELHEYEDRECWSHDYVTGKDIFLCGEDEL